MSNDYRNTKYCPELENLAEKKNKVVKMVKEQHPLAIDMHSYISKNDKPFKRKFMEAYNYKCAYCGVSISIIPKEMFEIDHYIYEKSAVFGGKKANAGYIENLLLSCHYCNHKKSSYEFLVEDRQYLYPDAYEIKDTFERDDMYYIQMTETFNENETVKNFYEQIKLGSEIHRIDFLLMNMIGLLNKLDNTSEVYRDLGKVIENYE